MNMKLKTPLQKIHFIGIGGIGMSAIAEVLFRLGFCVQGSDMKASPTTERLQALGISVAIGHSADNLGDADSVIISTATKSDNIEVIEAKRRGLPIGHRSDMLAEILCQKQSICVAGTHGKTTTSTLVASVLDQAGLDPSFIIGGIVNSHQSNGHLGQGDYIVAEADESDGSFLKLPTTISIVTNIDPEHMDFYKEFKVAKLAYATFLRNTAFYGFSVVCLDHPVVKEVIQPLQDRKIITYGFTKSADVFADRVRMEQGMLIFDVTIPKKNMKMTDVEVALLGRHNIQNALAAIAVAVELGIGEDVIKQALRNFKGVQRRLTIRGTIGKSVVYDDYAHHPVEVQATLKAVKDGTQGRVMAVFQPHRYSRLKDLWDGFLSCFKHADTVLICDVYGAGEDPISGVDSASLVQVLQAHHPNAHYVPGFNALADSVQKHRCDGDHIVFLGAGSLSAQTKEVITALKGILK